MAVATWKGVGTALSPIIGQPGVDALSKRSNYVTRSAINFSAIPTKDLDGENVHRSSYTITAPDEALIESTQGSVEHANKGDALDQAQVIGERRFSSLVADCVPVPTQPAWSTS
jgi:hypothetical protein